MSDKIVVLDVDEAVLAFVSDLLTHNKNIKISEALSNVGIGNKEIINSVEVKDDEKIIILKQLEKESRN